MIMLGSRGGAGGDAENGGARSRSAAPERARSSAAAATADAGAGGDFEDFPGALEDEDDDLPF
jgi:single-strand DNA-binding protein